MLVLSRTTDEWIQIGEVRVTILDLTASRVRLGIEAPEGVKVLRGELVERDKEKEAT